MAASSGSGDGHNPPLAKVMSMIAQGKTARDRPTEIAEDIALLKHAMNNPELQRALQELDRELGSEPSQEAIERAIKSP